MKPHMRPAKSRGFAGQTGKMIALLREEAGVSQLDLARRAGVTRSYVSTAEIGTTRISQAFVRAVIDALGIDADRAVLLLETFAAERGFVVIDGVGRDYCGAIVAAVERSRRRSGKTAVCPDCGVGSKERCKSTCGVLQ